MIAETNRRARIHRVVRRADSGEVDLTRRRIWYAHDGSTTPQQGADGAQDVQSLPDWAQKLIKDLRTEAADNRVTASRIKTEAEQAETARLAKLGEWETLAKNAQEKLAEVEPKSKRAEELTAFITASLKGRIEALPEAYRGMVPAFDDPLKTLAWLDANAKLLTMPAAPNLDAGAGNASAAQGKVSPELEALAKKMGVDPNKLT